MAVSSVSLGIVLSVMARLALHFLTLTVGTFTIYVHVRKIRKTMPSAEWFVLRDKKAPNEAVSEDICRVSSLTGV